MTMFSLYILNQLANMAEIQGTQQLCHCHYVSANGQHFPYLEVCGLTNIASQKVNRFFFPSRW